MNYKAKKEAVMYEYALPSRVCLEVVNSVIAYHNYRPYYIHFYILYRIDKILMEGINTTISM